MRGTLTSGILSSSFNLWITLWMTYPLSVKVIINIGARGTSERELEMDANISSALRN